MACYLRLLHMTPGWEWKHFLHEAGRMFQPKALFQFQLCLWNHHWSIVGSGINCKMSLCHGCKWEIVLHPLQWQWWCLSNVCPSYMCSSLYLYVIYNWAIVIYDANPFCPNFSSRYVSTSWEGGPRRPSTNGHPAPASHSTSGRALYRWPHPAEPVEPPAAGTALPHP